MDGWMEGNFRTMDPQIWLSFLCAQSGLFITQAFNILAIKFYCSVEEPCGMQRIFSLSVMSSCCRAPSPPKPSACWARKTPAMSALDMKARHVRHDLTIRLPAVDLSIKRVLWGCRDGEGSRTCELFVMERIVLAWRWVKKMFGKHRKNIQQLFILPIYLFALPCFGTPSLCTQLSFYCPLNENNYFNFCVSNYG